MQQRSSFILRCKRALKCNAAMILHCEKALKCNVSDAAPFYTCLRTRALTPKFKGTAEMFFSRPNICTRCVRSHYENLSTAALALQVRSKDGMKKPTQAYKQHIFPEPPPYTASTMRTCIKHLLAAARPRPSSAYSRLHRPCCPWQGLLPLRNARKIIPDPSMIA